MAVSDGIDVEVLAQDLDRPPRHVVVILVRLLPAQAKLIRAGCIHRRLRLLGSVVVEDCG